MKVRLRHDRLRLEISKKPKLSQNAWALRLGLDRGHFSKLLRGKRPYPSPKTRRKLLKGLGVPFEVLFECVQTPLRPSGSSGRMERPMRTFFQDVRYGVRRFSRRPSLHALSVFVLALGIGIAGTAFSLVEAFLLRPLPFREPSRLADVSMIDERLDAGSPISLPDLEDWKSAGVGFEELAAYRTGTAVMAGRESAEQIWAAWVEPEFFSLLGTDPRLGRPLAPSDFEDAKAGPVLVSERIWRQELGEPAQLHNLAVSLDGISHPIVGVMPSAFRFPWREGEGVDVWFPLIAKEDRRERGDRSYDCVGRLADGVSLGQAGNALRLTAAALSRRYPDTNGNHRPLLAGLDERLRGGWRTPLWTTLAAVGLALLVACLNLAHLNLAQIASRTGELALLSVLGAGRKRLIRQVALESAPACLLGGAFGLSLAAVLPGWAALRLSFPLPPGGFPLNLKVVGACLVVMSASLLVTTAMPAWWVSRRMTHFQTLKSVQRGSVQASGSHFLRGALVAMQVGLAFLLAAGALLLQRTQTELSRVDAGFRPQGVLALHLSLPRASYAEEQRQREFLSRALQAVRGIPGVVSAGAILNLPLHGGAYTTVMAVENRTFAPAERPVVEFQLVTPGYFESLGIALLEGRLPSAEDSRDGVPCVWINRSLAERYWPDQERAGKRINLTGFEGPDAWVSIAGVVEDVKHHGLRLPTRPEAYRPYAQFPARSFTLALRTPLTPLSLASAVRERLRRIDPGVPVSWLDSLNNVYRSSISDVRMTGRLLLLMALASLALGALGIHGVLACFVADRRREWGLRMALGAARGRICGMAVWKGMRPVIGGLALGLACALALTRLLNSLLFQVSSRDPGAFLVAGAVLLGASLLACLLPALQAVRSDPGRTLRSE